MNEFLEFISKVFLPPVEDISISNEIEKRSALYFLHFFCLLIKKYSYSDLQDAECDKYLEEMLRKYDTNKKFVDFIHNSHILTGLNNIRKEITF